MVANSTTNQEENATAGKFPISFDISPIIPKSSKRGRGFVDVAPNQLLVGVLNNARIICCLGKHVHHSLIIVVHVSPLPHNLNSPATACNLFAAILHLSNKLAGVIRLYRMFAGFGTGFVVDLHGLVSFQVFCFSAASVSRCLMMCQLFLSNIQKFTNKFYHNPKENSKF